MGNLPRIAKAYFGIAIGVGGALALAILLTRGVPTGADTHGWWVFAAFAAAATITRTLTSSATRNKGYCIALAFVMASVLLIDYSLLVITMIVLFIPEWAIQRRPAFIQAFNITTFIIAAVLARAVFVAVVSTSPEPWLTVAGGAAAILAFTLINHVTMAIALQVNKGLTMREAGLLTPDGLLIDTGLATCGACMAFMWTVNPWFVLLAAYPLVLVYRSLELPSLRYASITDPKTGLYNSRYFSQVAEEEIRRAVRYSRPVSIIMADLDLLRDVNNAYGHLAGDSVICEVAEIIERQVRRCDIAARFGGDEYAFLLPETDLTEALAAAERIRQTLRAHRFTIQTREEPMKITMSFGVASCPEHGCSAVELLHMADRAAHLAKQNGRDCIQSADELARATEDRHVVTAAKAPVSTLPSKDARPLRKKAANY